MATLQATGVTGSLTMGTNPITLPNLTNAQTGSFVSVAGSVWFNTTTGRIAYTNGSTVTIL
jgi:hypothetical protein